MGLVKLMLPSQLHASGTNAHLEPYSTQPARGASYAGETG